MDEQIKMHAEYQVECWVSEGAGWMPCAPGWDNPADAKRQRDNLRESNPDTKTRITMRLVGDWCELKEKENGK